MANKKTSIGGQALMEGIMMRGPEMTAMAVRRADGEIVMEEFPTNNSVPKICKLPLIRGVYGMVTSMAVGYKCMMRSADLYADDLIAEEEAKEAAKAAEKQTADGSDSTEGTTATETVAESTSDTTAHTEKAEKKESKKADKKDNKEEEGVFGTAAMIITVVLAVALMLGLFFWLPTCMILPLPSSPPIFPPSSPALSAPSPKQWCVFCC